MAAAQEMGATAVKYPKPAHEYRAEGLAPSNLACGVRVGVIARPDPDEAWRIANERFPEDRKGQFMRTVATKLSDSAWHKELAGMKTAGQSPYWLHPFENYQTNCPYLVGGYQQVAAELAGYIACGYQTYILDIPPCEEEFEHIGVVFNAACQSVTV